MPVFVDPTGYCYNSEGKQEKYWDTIYGTTRTINYTGVYNSSMCSSSDTINAFTNNTIRYRSHYSKDKTYGNRCIYIHNCSVSGSYFWQYLIAMDLEQYWRQDKSTPVQVNYCTDTSVKIANNQMSLCYFVDKHKAFAATSSTDKAKVYISNTNGNGTISFYGKGDLYLMVKPQRSRVNGISLPRKAGAAQTVTVTIPPASETSWYTYEKQNNGTYKITLKLEYAQLTAVEYIRDKHPQYSKNITFTKPSVPSRSSVIDYSQNVSNKPSYNTNNKTLVFTQQDNATYDTALGYWRLTGGSHCIVDMQKYAKNDFFFFTEEYNPQSKSVAKAIWYGNGNQKTYQSRISAMYLPGMVGMFFKGTEYWPGFGHGGSGNHKMIYGGFTQPINAVLYGYGMGGNGSTNINTDAYVNNDSDFNRTVLKKLTTDACSKLKTTGARVYVVKFRKQDKYNNIVSNNVTGYSNLTGSNTWTDTPTNHSYSEIDACATSTGGKKYEIGTQADDTASNGTSANATALKTTLDAIASDIKNWAEYEDARNITD